MNIVRQISRRIGWATGAWARSAVDYFYQSFPTLLNPGHMETGGIKK